MWKLYSKEEEDMSDTIYSILVVIATILMFGIIFFTIIAALNYYELKGYLKDCEKSFGKGNFTFSEEPDRYVCKAYNSQQYVSKSCRINDKEVPC
jgi:hypothetical protein